VRAGRKLALINFKTVIEDMLMSTSNFELNATIRNDIGKGASRRLRRLEGLVPGIIYGGGKNPVNLTFKTNEVSKATASEAFYASIINVKIDGKGEKAVVKAMQRHPAKDFVMHIDFLRVSEKTALQISVPLHFINEDICVAVKTGGGKVNHLMAEVEISCLPKDLPEYLEVDMAEVQLDQTVHLSDIKLPKGVTIVALTHGQSHDHPVASVHKPKAASEEDSSAPAADAATPEAGA
jgi:large subunit ribosomal protein L25